MGVLETIELANKAGQLDHVRPARGPLLFLAPAADSKPAEEGRLHLERVLVDVCRRLHVGHFVAAHAAPRARPPTLGLAPLAPPLRRLVARRLRRRLRRRLLRQSHALLELRAPRLRLLLGQAPRLGAHGRLLACERVEVGRRVPRARPEGTERVVRAGRRRRGELNLVVRDLGRVAVAVGVDGERLPPAQREVVRRALGEAEHLPRVRRKSEGIGRDRKGSEGIGRNRKGSVLGTGAFGRFSDLRRALK